MALYYRYQPIFQAESYKDFIKIGEGFAFDVSAQKTSYMFVYYNGNLAVLVYKS